MTRGSGRGAIGDPIRVPARFRGPVGVANGGYFCGLVAARSLVLQETDLLSVSLHLPPPLDTDLALVAGRTRIRVMFGDALVATVRRARTAPHPVPFAARQEALRASSGYLGYRSHPVAGCFVCGVEQGREALGIAPGPLAEAEDGVACTWTPPLAGSQDISPLMWAVMDCVSAWTLDHADGAIPLAEMTLRQTRPMRPGKEHVVVARRSSLTGGIGRVNCTLFDLNGMEIASASSLWIPKGTIRTWMQGGSGERNPYG